MYWFFHPFVTFKLMLALRKALKRKPLLPRLTYRTHATDGRKQLGESIDRLEMLVDEKHVARRLNTTPDQIKAFASRSAAH
jgi:hypothetical protein